MLLIPHNIAPRPRDKSRGFTIMELMVSIAILIIIILSVGVIFSNASKSVSSSTALMESLASVRGVQQQTERLVSGIDKNCFLVIRSQAIIPGNPNTGRFDQIAFISNGTFPNRTGSNPPSATPQYNPLNSNLVANAAHVWIGQLVMERANAPDNSYAKPDQSVPTPSLPAPNFLANLPTGIYKDSANVTQINETEFALGIHTTLMVPAAVDNNSNISPSNPLVQAYFPHNSSFAFPANTNQLEPALFPTYDIPEPTLEPNGGKGINIMSSRVAVAAQSPAQLMTNLENMKDWPPLANIGNTWPTGPDPVWAYLCYRFKALYSVYDTEVPNNPFINGYFRTQPVALQGVSSFKVEWTDGSVFVAGPNVGDYDASGARPSPSKSMLGQLKWYGSSIDDSWYPQGMQKDQKSYYLEKANVDKGWPSPANPGEFASLAGDNYMAVFRGANRTTWPKALRITIHVVDVNQRLQGGRDYVQIIQLP